MAIIHGIPGLEVRIVVHGQPLYEHQDRYAKVSAKTAERYIEAQSDAEYEIHFSFKYPFPRNRPVAMAVTIDGEVVDEPVIRPFELFDPKGHVSRGPVSQQAERWVEQNYSFSKIDIKETSEDTISENLERKLKRTGIITCKFYFLNKLRRNFHIRGAQKDIVGLSTVNEKAVKGDALSHQTVLSDIKPTEDIEYFDADYADGGKPFATFHFYYRSLAALKDLHIIERTPEPIDILDSDDSAIGQLNREQLQAIVRRFKEQEEARIRTKRELSNTITIEGDEADIGDGYHHSDPDLIETRWVDLRAQRKKVRVRQLPTPETEVIELDD